MSPVSPHLLDPPDLDLESQPPVIHDIVTSSPSDNEHLGATPFVTHIDMGAPRDVSASELLASEPEDSCDAPPVTEIPAFTEEDLDTPADIGMIPASPAVEGPDFTTEPEVSFPTETLTATDPPSHVEDEMSFVPDSPEPPSYVPDTESLVTESPISESPAPETVGSLEAEEEEEEKKKEEVEEKEEAAVEKEELDTTETVTQYEREEEEEEEEGMLSKYRDIYDATKAKKLQGYLFSLLVLSNTVIKINTLFMHSKSFKWKNKGLQNMSISS